MPRSPRPASPPFEDGRPVVRVSSTADLVASVPYLVGFTPQRSVVVMSLRGPRRRGGLTARVDLPPPGLERTVGVEALVSALVPPVVRDGAREVVVVVYGDDPWDADVRPHLDVVEQLQQGFASFDVTVKEAAYVGAERFWSYTCTLDACCPQAGRPVDQLGSGVVAATFVAQGRAPMADRSAMLATVGPPGPLVAAAVRSVAERESRWRGAGLHEDAVAAFDTLVQRRALGGPPATPDEAGLVLAGLVDVCVRDEVALRHCGWLSDACSDVEEGRDPVTAVLHDLATCSDGDWAVAPLTLLALQYWDEGDGALANACLDRALAADPGYRMARLAEQMLRAGIAPSRVEQQRREEDDAAAAAS